MAIYKLTWIRRTHVILICEVGITNNNFRYFSCHIGKFFISSTRIKRTKQQGICIENFNFWYERLFDACGHLQDVLLNEVKKVHTRGNTYSDALIPNSLNNGSCYSKNVPKYSKNRHFYFVVIFIYTIFAAQTTIC